MGCVYCGNWKGECQMWDDDNDSLNPEGADEEGFCTASEDEDPSWCQSYESDGADEDDEEVCDECGEPLGFCASDCSERGENQDG
jgi:hypothetical protein